MPTIILVGGAGVPVSDYEALLTEYVTYKSNHSHTNEEYEAHDIVRSKTIAIWCRWYGGEKGHQLMVGGREIGYTGPDGDNSRTVYYTVTIQGGKICQQ